MTLKKKKPFNEIEKAKDILKNGFSGGVFKPDELGTLAKYYNSIGFEGKKLENELIKFCKERVAGFSPIRYRYGLNKALKSAKKYLLKESKPIYVTEKELSKIKQLPIKYAKIFFVMLVEARFNHDYGTLKDNSKKSDKYYFYGTLSDASALAKFQMADMELKKMSNVLDIDYKLVKPAITDNNNRNVTNIWQIVSIEDDSEIALIVDNLDNIIDYFPFYCEKCGKNIERTGRRHKYCEECWKNIHREIDKNAKRQKRAQKY